MDLHASGDFHSGDSINMPKIPIHDTPKSTSNNKRRSGEDPTVISLPESPYHSTVISQPISLGVISMSPSLLMRWRNCVTKTMISMEKREMNRVRYSPVPSTVSLPFPVKTDSSESSVDDYKKKIASVRTRPSLKSEMWPIWPIYNTLQ